jgi:hypothetical protein
MNEVETMGRNGSRDKLRKYFYEHVGEVLDSDVLRIENNVGTNAV